MQIEYKSITELVPYVNNPRINDEAVEYVANSIKDFGFKVPIIIDKNNIIVAGHTRYKAAQQLGMNEVPIIRADDLTDEQIKAFRLADNKAAEMSEWDYDRLKMELKGFDLGLTDFGFGEFELSLLLDTVNSDDDEEESIDVNKDKRLLIVYDTEEEKEYLRGLLGVDYLEDSYDIKDLIQGEE